MSASRYFTGFVVFKQGYSFRMVSKATLKSGDLKREVVKSNRDEPV